MDNVLNASALGRPSAGFDDAATEATSVLSESLPPALDFVSPSPLPTSAAAAAVGGLVAAAFARVSPHAADDARHNGFRDFAGDAAVAAATAPGAVSAAAAGASPGGESPQGGSSYIARTSRKKRSTITPAVHPDGGSGVWSAASNSGAPALPAKAGLQMSSVLPPPSSSPSVSSWFIGVEGGSTVSG